MATTVQERGTLPSSAEARQGYEGVETTATEREIEPSFPGQEYDPYSFSKEVERLDSMQKTLKDVKQKLHQTNIQSLLLNADLVTMFDPVSTEELKRVVMECRQCAERMESMQHRDTQELQPSLAQGGEDQSEETTSMEHSSSCEQDKGHLETES